MGRKKLKPATHKPMKEAKKVKLQRHIDRLMEKGVKDKGRSKIPALTNKCGVVIKGSK